MEIETMMEASLYKMEFEKIMNAARLAGCDLLAEGEYIRITNSGHLPSSIKEKIKEHKSLFLEFLNRDTQAKQVGFMIGISGEVYTRSLSKNSIVYIEQIGGNWEAWRETYQKNNQRAISVKVICNAATFEYVLLKANSYFDYIERKSLY
ncbi:MAG: hypothetical protein AB2374_15410 [Cytobacillus gottheilii]